MFSDVTVAPNEAMESIKVQRESISLTQNWGRWATVSCYLDRCQVKTPEKLVQLVWSLVHRKRSVVGKVVDFGAGDGRFSTYGNYRQYIGYEIDKSQFVKSNIPSNAELVNCCAFTETILDADLCIGNPPYVRNQDIPPGWRADVSKTLHSRMGVNISGLANAWQYFFFLALSSVKADGLCALIVPFEWVSRPSAQTLRQYIQSNRWGVEVYRLRDKTFRGVFTTSSITIINKADKNGVWTYLQETEDGRYLRMPTPTGSAEGVIQYAAGPPHVRMGPYAVRGFSPGTQKVFILTEKRRTQFGLKINKDVVPCVTTLRHLPAGITDLDKNCFYDYYISFEKKCWLVVTQGTISKALTKYLDSVPPANYQTSTCLMRKQWWKFNLPRIPAVLVATSFRGKIPKHMINTIGASAVGGVCGIHNLTKSQEMLVSEKFLHRDIREQIVSHSNGLRKIEINQLNTLLSEMFDNSEAIDSRKCR